MSYKFPPNPAYPFGIDNDRTLFAVYNTSETITTQNNNAHASEIYIKPVGPNENEIWSSEGGYANINGELFYYGSVNYDLNGKINLLTNCSRDLGGEQTKFNSIGSSVRGFVVAEHHNQLVNAIVATEKFIGTNFTTDTESLDWRIRNLQQLPVIYDDYTCPDVIFEFDTGETNPASGTLATYSITINGSYTSFRLDFGDGQFTTLTTTGTHQYSPNANIDPILTITNASCSIVQSPIARTSAKQPQANAQPQTFNISIPTLPDLPTLGLIIPSPPVVSNIITQPPIVFPCLEVSPFSPNFPSVIHIEPPINLPSVIQFGPTPLIPSTINFGPAPYIPPTVLFGPVNFPSVVNFTNPPIIPTLIEFGPLVVPSLVVVGTLDIPSVVSFSPINIPSVISITPVDIPTFISITPIDIPTLISITPINIPTLISITPVNIPTFISITPVDIPTLISISPISIPTFVSFSPITIPSVISITPINIPSIISITPINIPTFISISPVDIPSQINFGPINFPTFISITPVVIPTLISMIGPNLPSIISVVNINVPSIISVVGMGSVPSQINFGPVSIPNVIVFAPPTIPTTISITPATITWGSPPSVTVNWGSPPACSCTVTIACPSSTPAAFMANSALLSDGIEPINVEMNDVGIPSEIMLRVPEIPDIRVLHDIPAIIQIETPNIPNITIIGPENPLPTEIRILADNIPTTIELIAKNIPEVIQLEAINLPSSIKLEVPEIPAISIDASGIPDKIQVVGIPETIELVGAPSEIKLVLPDKPEIELVYKGSPIDVKINLDVNRLTGEDGNAQCVAIVPCTK